MSILENILSSNDELALMLVTGHDDAILGVNEKEERLVYSVSKIISTLIERDGMTPEEAREFYEYNINGAYMGKKEPIYCEDGFDY
jgi:polyhydroxyalkanoate synthesis regulator phasin